MLANRIATRLIATLPAHAFAQRNSAELLPDVRRSRRATRLGLSGSWLTLLAAPALAQNPLFEVRGAPGESLGWEVRALDDRDGDGLPEVGAFFGNPQIGCRVLRGSDGSVLSEILGSPIGDADGDGQPDRLVAIAGNELGIASGDAGPVLWSVSFNLNGAPGMSAFPYDLGDVDGDARDDLMVNESWWGNAPPVSQFSVYSGVDGTLIHRRPVTSAFAEPWAVPVGDLDGDLVGEIALADAGALHLLHADGTELTSWIPPVEILGPLGGLQGGPPYNWIFAGGHLGGDVDGDGFPDLGFSTFSIPSVEPRTRLFAAFDGRPLYEAEGAAGSLAGDLDADGRADLVTWNDAGLEVHSPATGSILRQVRFTTAGWPWYPGIAVLGPEVFTQTFGAIIGDLDGDGLGELIVGENFPAASLAPMGRVRVFVGDASDEIGTRVVPPATACPCGTPGAGAGCPNSSGQGASLAAFGSLSAAEAHLVLTATEVSPDADAVLFVGTGPTSPKPFGAGVKLLSGPNQRVGSHLNTIHEHWWDTHTWVSGPATAGLAAPYGFNLTWVAGQTYHLQAWYTDPSNPCGGGFNLTNAVELTITP